jgi:hypothetical protein
VDVDVASTQAVAYIVKMVQGATRSMLIDHAYLLEAQFAHELPEQLIGAIRCAHSSGWCCLLCSWCFLQVPEKGCLARGVEFSNALRAGMFESCSASPLLQLYLEPARCLHHVPPFHRVNDFDMGCCVVVCRYKHLDMTDYTFLPVEQELPFTPVVPGIVGQ